MLPWRGALELKAFLELPDFEPTIDPLAVEDFFGLRYLIGDRTWFEGVELLPAATVLTWDIQQQSLQRDRYWWWDDVKPISNDWTKIELGPGS